MGRPCNRCGAPNGYLVVEVKGNAATWYYKATGHDSDYQFRVYRPNEFKSQADYLVVDVWDWDPTYQVTWSENGIEKGRMEQFDDEDQDYIDMHGNLPDIIHRTYSVATLLPESKTYRSRLSTDLARPLLKM